MHKKDENPLEVEGFLFHNEAEAKRAKKEVEGVKYIRSKIDMEQPQKVLELYNHIVRENRFSTVIGISYLKDLQEYLTTISYVKKEELRPIPIKHLSTGESKKEAVVKEKKYQLSLLVNIILLVSVICMFLISATSGHPNILNYETEIINRYSAWEQELNEREEALRELENK